MVARKWGAGMLALWGGLVTASEARAGEMPLNFSGFGTLGVSHSSQVLGDYVLDSTQPKGAGRSYDWSFGNDSRIGLQASADLSPDLSAVVQVVAEYQYDNSYTPAVEWANLKYELSPDAFLRIGRIALPTFLYSDNRKVGYSIPWVHPPVDLYRQLAITNSDGVDFKVSHALGEGVNTVHLLAGQNKLDRTTSVSHSKDLWGIFDTVEYGAALFRIGYQQRRSAAQNRLTNVLGVWTPNSDLTVGLSYDPGAWFATYEWLQRESTYKSSAYYLSAGCRIDKFTPYATFSSDSLGALLPGFPPPTANTLRTIDRSQQTLGAGLRWDFMQDVDFKLQYDWVKLGPFSNGYLTNVPAGVNLSSTRFHLLTATVDFVF